MKHDRLNELRSRMEAMAKVIGADPKYLPELGETNYDAHPFVLDVHGTYHYVIQERNTEYERLIFSDETQLLYQVFKGVTSQLASTFELIHRIPNQDCRRIQFAKQQELMAILNSAWVGPIATEQRKILDRYPFEDELY